MLLNPSVTRDSSFLMIFDALGTVWAVQSTRHPLKQFVDDFLVPRAVWAVESTRHL